MANSDLVDAGVIFGTGFAPFRGGPLRYVQQHNADELNRRFDILISLFGERFERDEGLKQLTE